MPEIQLGAHTLRSHGVQVARIHMHDWLILFLLVVIDIALNVIEPFHRFVGKGMMEDLRYPLKGNTVPFWAVPVCWVLSSFMVHYYVISIVTEQNFCKLTNYFHYLVSVHSLLQYCCPSVSFLSTISLGRMSMIFIKQLSVCIMFMLFREESDKRFTWFFSIY